VNLSSQPLVGVSSPHRRLLLATVGYALALLLGVLLDGTLREPLLASLGYGLPTLAVLLCAALAGSWRFLAAGIPLLVLLVVFAGDDFGFAISGPSSRRRSSSTCWRWRWPWGLICGVS
jgi:hypothetical protein